MADCGDFNDVQVGALRDIKRDMAQRRNSLHKQLVHELEDRVFVSVGNPKGATGTTDDPDGDEDDAASVANSIMPSAAPSPGPSSCLHASPPTQCALDVASWMFLGCPEMHIGKQERADFSCPEALICSAAPAIIIGVQVQAEGLAVLYAVGACRCR